MEKFYLYLPVLCFIAALALFSFGGLSFDCMQNAQGSSLIVAGSIALLASAVAARRTPGK